MIEMIAGVFGLPVKDKTGKTIRIKGMGPNDGPFSAAPEREAELVKKGVARYVEQIQVEDEDSETEEEQIQVEDDGAPIGFDETPPEDFGEDEAEIVEEIIDLETFSAKELRELGKDYGLTFKANASKVSMIEAITAAQDAIAVDEDAPTFDAAEAVEE